MDGLIAVLLILIPISLVGCVLHAIVFHKQSRDRLETSCVKESHLKTFFDNFFSNLLIILPVVLTVAVMSAITEAFL
jgi:uncharacterized membrane protein